MAKAEKTQGRRDFVARHMGRAAQVWICLGKLMRMFVYQNDWKVLPMSALIAGLVGMVIRKKFCLSMEGTLMGAFALVCVCLWNGAFNSIQVICRERDVLKREHRSGLHVFAYVFAHMLYQAFLCLLQTGITLYVTMVVGVKYPTFGVALKPFMVELGISMFLITYASDMLSLWVSSLSRGTTTAMTIMPFVLIFQLVFSGGMLTLPSWTEPLTQFTVSNPGLKVIAAQADVNNRPFVTISDMLGKMWDEEIEVSVSLGDVLDALSGKDSALVSEIRSQELASLPELARAAGYPVPDAAVPAGMTVGDAVDLIAADPNVQARREERFTDYPSVGEIVDLVGEEKVRSVLEEKSAKASYRPAYEYTAVNVVGRWLHLAFFAAVFALFTMITLKFIDKDKR